MTLQQLKYADAVATYGSVSEASRRVFASQPTLTEAIHSLEEELRIAIFTRSNRGVVPTREGEEFLSYARQILDDASRIQAKYTGKAVRRAQFAVTCQHYAFAVEAFMEVVRANDADSFDFTLRETVTSEILDDVAHHRSEIGVLYLSRRNEAALTKLMKKEDLSFEELFVSRPHVFLGKGHPLAKKRFGVSPRELDAYPYISFEQGTENALYFSEEVMPAIDRKKNIRVRDRATMTNMILGLDGYTVASGALSRDLNGPDIVAVPLKMDDTIRVGLVTRAGVSLSAPGAMFAASIKRRCESLAGNVRRNVV